MYTHSERHVIIVNKIQELAAVSKNLQDLAQNLKKNSIRFEDIELASGRQLLIFTGSSGYDIVGVSVKNSHGELVLEEIFN